MHFQALEAALRSLSYDTLVKVCSQNFQPELHVDLSTR